MLKSGRPCICIVPWYSLYYDHLFILYFDMSLQAVSTTALLLSNYNIRFCTVPWHNFSFCKILGFFFLFFGCFCLFGFFLFFVFYIIFVLHVLLHLRLKRYVFYIEHVLCYIIILLCCKCKFTRGPIWLVKLNKYKYINVYMFRHDSNCQLDGLYVYSLCISASCVSSKQCYPGVRSVWQSLV